MEIFIENETDEKFGFDYEQLIRDVVCGAIDYVNCPYESVVNVTIVDDEAIHKINFEYRDIDKPTDVLSFPMVEYDKPGTFDMLDTDEYNDCFDPDTGHLILGDIIISSDKVQSQAKEFGHSIKRELGFLVAHSMFHLFGYDHMEEEEREQMERMQKELLCSLNITRDDNFDSTIKLAAPHMEDYDGMLVSEAKKAMEYAYSPYSGFKVGAALLTGDGQVFTGCNVENASYGGTICAERCAAVKAVSSGCKSFLRLAIVSSSDDYTYPCGICRQFLSEFNSDLVIVLSNKQGEIKEVILKELLPRAFSM